MKLLVQSQVYKVLVSLALSNPCTFFLTLYAPLRYLCSLASIFSPPLDVSALLLASKFLWSKRLSYRLLFHRVWSTYLYYYTLPSSSQGKVPDFLSPSLRSTMTILDPSGNKTTAPVYLGYLGRGGIIRKLCTIAAKSLGKARTDRLKRTLGLMNMPWRGWKNICRKEVQHYQTDRSTFRAPKVTRVDETTSTCKTSTPFASRLSSSSAIFRYRSTSVHRQWARSHQWTFNISNISSKRTMGKAFKLSKKYILAKRRADKV